MDELEKKIEAEQERWKRKTIKPIRQVVVKVNGERLTKELMNKSYVVTRRAMIT